MSDVNVRSETRQATYGVCMARVNIYLPDDLARRAGEAGLNVSGIAQEALEHELRVRDTNAWLDRIERQPALSAPSREELDAIWSEVDEEAERRADAIVDRLAHRGEG